MKIIYLLTLCALLLASCEETGKAETDKMTTNLPEDITDDVSDKLVETEKTEPVVVEETFKQKSERLKAEGYQIFDYVDPESQDTLLMQQYYMAFLKLGNVRNQNEEESERLQEEHLAHLSKMYELGYADISGPFGDNGEIRGVTIYNVPTMEMADSLANADPMVKAGRLQIEIHPWWAAKGYPLR